MLFGLGARRWTSGKLLWLISWMLPWVCFHLFWAFSINTAPFCQYYVLIIPYGLNSMWYLIIHPGLQTLNQNREGVAWLVPSLKGEGIISAFFHPTNYWSFVNMYKASVEKKTYSWNNLWRFYFLFFIYCTCWTNVGQEHLTWHSILRNNIW